MDDLTITRLCAEAMGYLHTPDVERADSYPAVQLIAPETGWKHEEPHFLLIECPSEGAYPKYDPLHDDAQAMALVKKFELCLTSMKPEYPAWMVESVDSNNRFDVRTMHDDLNRAIVECVANMRRAKG